MGNEIKTRNPQWLYHSDYLTFGQGVKGWCASQVGEPDYPAHLVPDFEAKFDAFADAWAMWDDLNQEQGGKNDVYSNASKAIAKHLQLLKDVFPTTIDDPPVLAEFGLDRPVPRDRDDIYTMAKTCVDQWIEVIGGGVPPEYEPLAPDFDVLLSLFSAFETAKDEYLTTFNAAQQAQNDVLTTREACHEAERKIFNWYRARHKDANDEWWTGTWWGTASEQEPPAPELPVFPNPPLTFTLSLRPDGTIEVVWTGVAGATHMLLEKRKQGEIDWSLVMNGLPADPAEILPYIDPYISPGIWEYRMIPMNGDEHGMEIVAVIEVPEG
jgi:hypothetical protein